MAGHIDVLLKREIEGAMFAVYVFAKMSLECVLRSTSQVLSLKGRS